MKKVLLISAAISVWMVVLFTSCKKEEVVPIDSDASAQTSVDEIVNGWPDGMVHLNELDSIR